MKEPESQRINAVGAVAFLLVGAIVSVWLLIDRGEPERIERTESSELVTVIEAEEVYSGPLIQAQGTVIPARKVTLQPQVSGRVVERHPGLVNGGVVQRGEVLLRIDPRDYEIAVEEARTDVELARAELAMEEGRQVVAKQEWERFGTQGEEPPPLALREPQLRQAELEIIRAEHRLQRALLDLERTRLRAPFTGIVTQAAIEPGELITPSQAAATLVALDEFWVQVAVPLDALGLLTLPGRDGELGSRAFVRHQSGEQIVDHEGRVIRLLGDLDPAGRMARLLVRVEDPFSLTDSDKTLAAPDTPALRRHPLMLGSYVSVELEGADPRYVIELPRHAVHEGKYVYLAGEDDRLQIREVTLAWRSRNSVAVSRGLEPGERVVVSGLTAPVASMALRVETSPASDYTPRRSFQSEFADSQNEPAPADDTAEVKAAVELADDVVTNGLDDSSARIEAQSRTAQESP